MGSCVALVAWLGLRHSSSERALRDRTAIATLLASGIDAGEFTDSRPRDALLLQLQQLAAPLPELTGATLYEPGTEGWHAMLDAGTLAGPQRLAPDSAALSTLVAGLPHRQAEADGLVLLAPVRDDSQALIGILRVQFDCPAEEPSLAGVLLLGLALLLGICCGLLAVRLLGQPIERLFAGTRPGPQDDASPTLQGLAVDLDALVDRLRRRGDEAPVDPDSEAFLANTVHELRTPLTTILASLDMLRDGYAASADEQREFLDQATTATHHLMFVVNDLLDSAALDAGRLRIDLQPCFVRELVEDSARLMRPLALARDIALAAEAPAGDPRVLGDRNRILQVLFNLLSNAMKFTPRGGHVRLRATTDGDHTTFTVEDDGPGVPEEARARLFTRFGRAANADRRIAGTGIGLYLSKALIEQMRGRIGFRPVDPGPGALFWFELNRVRDIAAVESRTGPG